MSDALVALSISGENVFDLLSAGIAIDWQRFSVGTCARMRLGETAVVLHRREEQQFRLIFGAPFARYLAEWLAHHV
ncbi:MAG: hypothetical protein HEQ34_05270 [Sphingorhabdus sp.]|uniref:hypothetical protein n=1 Tax=Sphingorhabdus sp. TaxID=1902408 RepID=UPI0025E82513|nr:hypothetical protein [Sphingorhabdus sp.]MCO4091352.1 hypothetical protein [Sphingorhabdus sp.]